MYKVQAKQKGKREVNTFIESGIIIGHADKDHLIAEVVGETNFDEILDDFSSALYHLMHYANDQTEGKAKDEIYKRVNQSVSLVLDKFHPEMTKNKKHGPAGVLTDEDIIKMENKKLKDMK